MFAWILRGRRRVLQSERSQVRILPGASPHRPEVSNAARSDRLRRPGRARRDVTDPAAPVQRYAQRDRRCAPQAGRSFGFRRFKEEDPLMKGGVGAHPSSLRVMADHDTTATDGRQAPRANDLAATRIHSSTSGRHHEQLVGALTRHSTVVQPEVHTRKREGAAQQGRERAAPSTGAGAQWHDGHDGTLRWARQSVRTASERALQARLTCASGPAQVRFLH